MGTSATIAGATEPRKKGELYAPSDYQHTTYSAREHALHRSLIDRSRNLNLTDSAAGPRTWQCGDDQ